MEHFELNLCLNYQILMGPMSTWAWSVGLDVSGTDLIYTVYVHILHSPRVSQIIVFTSSSSPLHTFIVGNICETQSASQEMVDKLFSI